MSICNSLPIYIFLTICNCNFVTLFCHKNSYIPAYKAYAHDNRENQVITVLKPNQWKYILNLWQSLLQENHYSNTFLQVRFFYWIRTWDDFAGKTSGSSSGPFRTEVQRKRNRFDEKATSCKSFLNHNCKYLLYHCFFTQSCLSYHNFESHEVFKISFTYHIISILELSYLFITVILYLLFSFEVAVSWHFCSHHVAHFFIFTRHNVVLNCSWILDTFLDFENDIQAFFPFNEAKATKQKRVPNLRCATEPRSRQKTAKVFLCEMSCHTGNFFCTQYSNT